MAALAGDPLLRAWERGTGLTGEPLAAALLDAADPPPGLPWSEQPLGVREAALLRLHDAGASGQLETVADCGSCSATVEVALPLARLLAPYDSAPPQPGWFDLPTSAGPVTVRHPSAADLLAASTAGDEAAARDVLVRRCVRGPAGAAPTAQAVAAAAAVLEDRDPLCDVSVAVTCGECGHTWDASLDVVTLVWAGVRVRALDLLREVDVLARRYGWSESLILSLTPARRRTYLDLG